MKKILVDWEGARISIGGSEQGTILDVLTADDKIVRLVVYNKETELVSFSEISSGNLDKVAGIAIICPRPFSNVSGMIHINESFDLLVFESRQVVSVDVVVSVSIYFDRQTSYQAHIQAESMIHKNISPNHIRNEIQRVARENDHGWLTMCNRACR